MKTQILRYAEVFNELFQLMKTKNVLFGLRNIISGVVWIIFFQCYHELHRYKIHQT